MGHLGSCLISVESASSSCSSSNSSTCARLRQRQRLKQRLKLRQEQRQEQKEREKDKDKQRKRARLHLITSPFMLTFRPILLVEVVHVLHSELGADAEEEERGGVSLVLRALARCDRFEMLLTFLSDEETATVSAAHACMHAFSQIASHDLLTHVCRLRSSSAESPHVRTNRKRTNCGEDGTPLHQFNRTDNEQHLRSWSHHHIVLVFTSFFSFFLLVCSRLLLHSNLLAALVSHSLCPHLALLPSSSRVCLMHTWGWQPPVMLRNRRHHRLP